MRQTVERRTLTKTLGAGRWVFVSSEKCPRGHQVRRKLPDFWDGTSLAGQTLGGMLREGKKMIMVSCHEFGYQVDGQPEHGSFSVNASPPDPLLPVGRLGLVLGRSRTGDLDTVAHYYGRIVCEK